MITLQEVNAKNVWDIVNLSVKDEQKSFVATNTESILEAYVTTKEGKTALPFGIYEDTCLVGFVMFGYDRIDEDDPCITDNNYCIWRFMIDKTQQGKGLGRKALVACLQYLKTYPCGIGKACWLSYEIENVGAKALYTSIGFQENGEVCEDEIVSVIEL